jgi:ubiquinone/menaquinone biosynthesis C-methylase UbiE
MDVDNGRLIDVPLSVGFRTMVTFQGDNDSALALYAPTMPDSQSCSVMLRSADGVNFDIVSEEGMGFPDAYMSSGVRALTAFKGRLFTAPISGRKGQQRSFSFADSMVILETTQPAGGKWRLACEPHFGDPNNLSVYEMAEFNGYLYAGTLNINEGFQIWKAAAEGEPPYKWKRVITQGAYRGRTNQIAMTLCPFGDSLYVGSAIQNGGIDVANNVGPAGIEVLRINPDDSWDLVVGDPRATPEGLKVPLSGLGAGFGNTLAGYLHRMCVHEGRLYAGTADSLCWVQYGDRATWPEEMRRAWPPKTLEERIHKSGGFSLWRSEDGRRWTPVTRNGFGNCYNMTARTLVSTPYGLFVGAINPFAPDVAVRRVAGWTYEPNPRGGLEIWLGSPHPGPDEAAETPKQIPDILPRRALALNGLEESGPEATESIIDQFYGGSRFRHVGFWGVGVQDAQAACENLMGEILAFIPEKKGSILEIGCGLGATTQYLSKYFPPEAITPITGDKKELQACRKTVSGVEFLHRRLPKLKLPVESFDFAIWVKGWHHLGPRGDLLRETFRVLKPAGRFVCFDVLPAAKTAHRTWKNLWSLEDSMKTLDEYRDLLLATGFSDVRLANVTTESLEGFEKHLSRYLELGKLSSAIDETMVQNVRTYFKMDRASSRQCLLISGCKEGGQKENGSETKNSTP